MCGAVRGFQKLPWIKFDSIAGFKFGCAKIQGLGGAGAGTGAGAGASAGDGVGVSASAGARAKIR